MSLTLKEINPRLANEFIHLKEFCSCEDNDLSKGVALKNKKSNRILCFIDYDLWRSRGEYFECKRIKCKYYCYIDPNQTTLNQFIQEVQ